MFETTIKYSADSGVLERMHPFGLGVPDDIAKAAVMLASEDASWITGVSLPVDGGYTAQ